MNCLFRAKARNYQVFSTPQAKAWVIYLFCIMRTLLCNYQGVSTSQAKAWGNLFVSLKERIIMMESNCLLSVPLFNA